MLVNYSWTPTPEGREWWVSLQKEGILEKALLSLKDRHLGYATREKLKKKNLKKIEKEIDKNLKPYLHFQIIKKEKKKLSLEKIEHAPLVLWSPP